MEGRGEKRGLEVFLYGLRRVRVRLEDKSGIPYTPETSSNSNIVGFSNNKTCPLKTFHEKQTKSLRVG